jgi:lysophospholipase
LSYLLSKPELSVKEVRELVTTPLRGELTRPSLSAPSQPATVDQNLDHVESVLSQFVRLSRPPTAQVPQILVSPDALDSASRDATKPWSWTAAEAANTEAILIPFLIHLAAAKDDIESMKFCIDSTTDQDSAANPMSPEQYQFGNIAGGIVNCFEPASGKSPLHVAAMNGNLKSVELLLRSGALVHLRDSLGHTALYYVSVVFFCSLPPHSQVVIRLHAKDTKVS